MPGQQIKSLFTKVPENNRLERIWKLAQLDFKKRYYHDNLGIFWSMLRPLFRISVYYFVFKIVMEMEIIENYALFLFSGLVFWTVFVEGTSNGKNLIKRKRYLIENIQFNKIDLFISDALSNFISFIITFAVYSIIAYLVGIRYNLNIFYLIVVILNLYLITMGASMVLTVMYIFVKDITHLWDVVKLFLFWTSGVFMRGEKFLEFFPPFIFLNPLVGIMINVRQIVFFIEPVDFSLMGFCFLYGVTLYAIGYFLFLKYSDIALERY